MNFLVVMLMMPPLPWSSWCCSSSCQPGRISGVSGIREVSICRLFPLVAREDVNWSFRFTISESGKEKPSEALLNWDYVQDRLPWGIVLLLGGGFALSDASKESGLSAWLGTQLAGLGDLPPLAIMFIICIMTATVTEIASNTATANILLPILAEMVSKIWFNVLLEGLSNGR